MKYRHDSLMLWVKRLRGLPRRTMAVVLSVVILLMLCPVSLLSSADAEVPYTSVAIADFEKYNFSGEAASAATNWVSWATQSGEDVTGGGVKITYTNASASPECRAAMTSTAITFDGMELLFSDFTEKADSNFSGFGVVLSNATVFRIKPDTMTAGYFFNFYLDAVNGRVLFNPHLASDAIELKDDALKAANLQGKKIAMSFNAMTGGAYKFAIKVYTSVESDGVTLTKALPANAFQGFSPSCFTAPTTGTAYYVALTPGYSNSNTLSGGNLSVPSATGGAKAKNNISYVFNGYRVNPVGGGAQVSAAQAVIDAIDMLPNPVTEADALVINKTKAAYDALNSTDKGNVSNEYLLTAAMSDLATVLKDGYTAFTVENTSAVTVTPVDAGLNMTIDRANTSPTVRARFNGQYTFDGLRIKFNNFHPTSTDSTVAGFGFTFSTRAATDFYNANGAVGVLMYINTVSGKLILNAPKLAESNRTGSEHYYELITDSEVLKQAKLAHNAATFTIRSTEDATNPYKVTIALADGSEVSANIPAKYIVGTDAFDANGKSYVSLVGGYCNNKGYINGSYSDIVDGTNRVTVDIVGQRNIVEAAQAVSRLKSLIDTLPAEVSAVTEAHAATINKAMQDYKILSAEDKKELEAADLTKLEAAAAALPALLKDGYTAFTVENASAVTVTPVDAGLNMTIDRANTSPTVRARFNGQYTFDGLRIKFNNFQPTSTDSTVAGFGFTFSTLATTDFYNKNSAVGVLMYINTVSGKLILNAPKLAESNRTGSEHYCELITDSEVLKQAKLAHTVATFTILATEDEANPYKVTIALADGSEVSANIPAKYIVGTDAFDANGKSYVSLVGGYCNNKGYINGSYSDIVDGTNRVTVDIVGQRNIVEAAQAVHRLQTLIDTIPAEVSAVTEAHAAAINEAMQAYTLLSSEDKKGMNAADLTKLEKAAEILQTVIGDGYTPWNKAGDFDTDYWATSGTRNFYDWGTRIAFNRGNLTPAFRVGVKQALELDGLKMKFSNFHVTDTAATEAGFGIQFSSAAQADFTLNRAGLLLYLDVKNGKVLLNTNGTDNYAELLTGSTVLTLDKLSYTTFTVEMLATEDADKPYKMIIELANGEQETVEIPAAYFNEDVVMSDPTAGKTFVTFTAGRYTASNGIDGKLYNTFDVYGHKNTMEVERKVRPLIAAIDALPDTITEMDAAAVNAVMVKYEELAPAMQELVTNNAKLLKLNDDLLALAQKDYTPWVGENSFTYDYWVQDGYRTYTDWGIRVAFNRANLNPAYRLGIAEPVVLDGMKVKINNFHVTNSSATDAGFGVQFSGTAAADFTQYHAGLLLYVDIKNGKIILNTRDKEGYIYRELLSGSEVLTLEKMSYTTFSIAMNATNDAENPWIFTIQLASGEKEEVLIPKECFQVGYAMNDEELGNTYLTFTAGRYKDDSDEGVWAGSVYNTFDILGYMNTTEVERLVVPVIKMIDNLPATVTLNDQEKIEEAVQAYEELRVTRLKLMVTNYDKLAKAVSDLYTLWDEANVDPYTGKPYVTASGTLSTITSSSNLTGVINNAALMPEFVTDDKVTVTEFGTPDWVGDLIMMGCRIETATPEGTFQSAIKVLDHCAEMGVNGLWITPVNDKGTDGNGYINLGPATIDPRLTGEIGYDEEWRLTDYEAGWKVFADFVEEAHKRNIRIFLDIVSWGTHENSPLFSEHFDWYTGNGFGGVFTNKEWDHENAYLQEYFINTIVDVVEKTDVDGLRYDMEPNHFGNMVDGEIRARLLEKGIKIAAVSEAPNERGYAYDFEQWGVLGSEKSPSTNPQNLYTTGYNMVDSIQSGDYIGSLFSQAVGDGGTATYYTMMLSCHDFNYYAVNGNELLMGYQAMYAPFIPLWFIGEEWNNTKVTASGQSPLLFGTTINWDELDQPEHRAFYESVKQMIQIRRTYKDLFGVWTENHRDTNICEVKVAGQDELVSYARYAGQRGMLIIPNGNLHSPDATFKVYVPLADMNLNGYESYKITDALSGEVVLTGNEAAVQKFLTKVGAGKMALFLIEASGNRVLPVEKEEEPVVQPEVENVAPVPTPLLPADDTADDNTTEEDGDSSYQEQVIIRRPVKVNKNNGSGFPWIWVMVGAGAAVVIAGGVVVLLVIRKKRRT